MAEATGKAPSPQTDYPVRPICRPKPGAKGKDAITPEMRAMAEALAHPEGDPYTNGRKMGFFCEQCG